MTVIATAGHVDHGKSTLVKFLTNQKTDRLQEEQKRGLTINLGYTFFEIKNEIISIVDVPGHKDYFKNTIAGFSNVDGILFCVDATQGWSQQSEEHFQSIKWLGIKNIIFVITKTDLVEERFNTLDLEEKIKELSPKNFNIIEYSSKESDANEIRSIIFDTFCNEITTDSVPHVWIDRSFIIDGVGKVITGTANKNFSFDNIYCGEELVEPKEVKSTNEVFKVTNSTKRVAISLKKNKNDSVGRGDILANSKLQNFDYFLVKCSDANTNFEIKGDIRVYFGTNNQVVSKIHKLKIDSESYFLIQLSNKLPGLLKSKMLLHNLKNNSFFGVDTVYASNNTHLIKKIIKFSKLGLEVQSEDIFTLKPKLLNYSQKFISINQYVVSKEKISKIENEVNKNFAIVNKTGVKNYFEQKYFIESENIPKIMEHFSTLNLINNQLQKINTDLVDHELLQQISHSLSKELEVNEIDLTTYDKEAVKKLFMNNLLYRVNQKIVITIEHKKLLLNIIHSLSNEFSVNDFKSATNLSRKYAIPYLEFLDKSGVTTKTDKSGKRKKLI
jgi:small GTP-binding protein